MSSRRPTPERQKLTGLYAYVLGLLIAVVILDGLGKAIAGRSRTRTKALPQKLTPAEVSLSNLGLGLVLATATTLLLLPEGGTKIEWTTDRAWIVGILFVLYVVVTILVARAGGSGLRQALVEQFVTVVAGFGLAVLGRQPGVGFVLVAIAAVILVVGGLSVLAREKRNAPRPTSPLEETGAH